MSLVVAVTKCLEISPLRTVKFHFDGVYDGEKIRGIKGFARGKDQFDIEIGGEYIVHLETKEIRDGVLHGDIVRVRSLDKVMEEMGQGG